MSIDRAGSGHAKTWFAGLDGLRALAVAAVVVFHFAPTALPGGFLGVDLFFVVSGYLITRLLLAEIEGTGRIGLRNFYERRMRRLFPAVVTLLAVAGVASVLFWRDQLVTIRGAMLSCLTYVTNWWLIGDHQSYFVSTGRPSMLQHLWSLAIEEQFYLVWPAVLIVLTVIHRRWRKLWRRKDLANDRFAGLFSLVALVALLGALASAAEMAWLAVRLDIPYGADSGRVYFGTDAHASGLLLGACVGALVMRLRLDSRGTFGLLGLLRRTMLFRGAFWSDLAALAAFVGLIEIAASTDEFTPWLYRGGFLLISALCALLVAATPRRLSLIPWALERRPVRWLGSRSYSVYLWHWPVTVVTRPDLDVTLHGWALFGVRTGLTVLLAEGSYRLVERPFRVAGWTGLARAWGWHRLPGRTRVRILPAIGTLVLVVAVSLVTALAYPPPRVPADASPITSNVVAMQPISEPQPATALSPRGVDESALNDMPSVGASDTPQSRPTPHRKAPARKPTTPRPTPSQSAVAPKDTVSAFGDSVMLGAAPVMAADIPHLGVSAIEGRQARDVYNDIAAHKAAHRLGDIVVIHAGDNGIIAPSDLSATLQSLSDRKLVIVLTDKVPRDWESPNNTLLRRTVPKYRNAVLVDWNKLAGRHQNWFYPDGLHLQDAGKVAFTDAIVAALKG